MDEDTITYSPRLGLGPFRMEADSDRSVVVVKVLVYGIILVAALGFGLVSGPSGMILSGAIIAGVGVFQGVDYWLWVRRGVRVVEVDRDGLTVYRGRERRPERIARERITGVNVHHAGPRIIVNIMLGGQVARAPGATFFSGPRLRITNDNFNDGRFGEFVELVQKLPRVA